MINCKSTELDDETIAAMDAIWAAVSVVAAPLLLTSHQQVVHRWRQTDQLVFRCGEFESDHLLWQKIGPASAVIQQRRHGRLLFVHLLSRTSAQEISWEQKTAKCWRSTDQDFADLVGLIILAPCFEQWSEPSISIAEKKVGTIGAN